jgi:prephenate dehydrogenase
MREKIGIIGLGDLGKRLATQVASSGLDVIAFDKRSIELLGAELAIDPMLNVEQTDWNKIKIVGSPDEVIRRSPVIHWAVQSSLLHELPSELPDDTLVILHDSVMSNSEIAVAERDDASKFCIVHCLVNSRRRVFIAGDNKRAIEHFRAIGLEPKVTTVREHDKLLAHSQGLLATLVEMGVRSELERAFFDGDLTPSGEELHALLEHRELNWTASTLRSILKNPELRDLKSKIR